MTIAPSTAFRDTLCADSLPARLLEALWLTAAVAVPLLVNPWGANAFELPKSLLLRALVLLMALAALLRAAETHSWHPRDLPPLTGPALALGLVLALATLVSVNPRASLWGSYERQQGLLTLVALLALCLLCAAHLRTREQFERLWGALLLGSVPVVVYGLCQAAGLDPLDWQSDAASPVLSTIGRANFFGSYLVLLAPLTAGRLLLARRRWPLALLLAAQLVTLALTQARGAWVGLAVAALTFALLWAAVTRKRWLAVAALAAALLVAGLLALLNWPGGPLSTLAELPALERLSTMARSDAGSTAARLVTWRATLPLIAARPWFGYGPETMRTVFARVFPPQLVYYQGRQVTMDRAHNFWLDVALSAGLAGVAAWVALLLAFACRVGRGLRAAAAGSWQRVAWVALTAAVAGHLVDLQFGFELTASATVFWLLLALAAALARPHPISPALPSPLPQEGEGKGGWGAGVRAFLLSVFPPTLAALLLLNLVCLRPLLADVSYSQARQGDPAAAARAVRLWPLEPEYRLQLAWDAAQQGDLATAEAQLAAADRLSPADPRVWALRAEIAASWGRYAEAEAAVRRTLELAPNVAAYHTALGLVLARQGRLDEALRELERAVALDATDAVAYRHLADLYRALGRDADAAWAAGEAQRWGEE